MAYAVFVLTSNNGGYWSNDFEFLGTQPTWTTLGKGGASAARWGDIDQNAENGIYVALANSDVYYRGIPPDPTNWTLRLTANDVKIEVGSSNLDLLTYICSNKTISGRVYIVARDIDRDTLVMCRSSDYGETWDFIDISGTNAINVDNCSIWADGSTIYVRWSRLSGGVINKVAYSSDNGVTWSNTSELSSTTPNPDKEDSDVIAGVPGQSFRIMTAALSTWDGRVHKAVQVNSDGSIDRKTEPWQWAFDGRQDLWIDPTNFSHQRWLGNPITNFSETRLMYTNNLWLTVSNGGLLSFPPISIVSHLSVPYYILVGASSVASARGPVSVMAGEGDNNPADRSIGIGYTSVVGSTRRLHITNQLFSGGVESRAAWFVV